jgi:hypothetical protein
MPRFGTEAGKVRSKIRLFAWRDRRTYSYFFRRMLDTFGMAETTPTFLPSAVFLME